MNQHEANAAAWAESVLSDDPSADVSDEAYTRHFAEPDVLSPSESVALDSAVAHAQATGAVCVTQRTERRTPEGDLVTEDSVIAGHCLNCGSMAYARGDSSARHYGTHKMACADPTVGSLGVTAALTND